MAHDIEHGHRPPALAPEQLELPEVESPTAHRFTPRNVLRGIQRVFGRGNIGSTPELSDETEEIIEHQPEIPDVALAEVMPKHPTIELFEELLAPSAVAKEQERLEASIEDRSSQHRRDELATLEASLKKAHATEDTKTAAMLREQVRELDDYLSGAAYERQKYDFVSHYGDSLLLDPDDERAVQLLDYFQAGPRLDGSHFLGRPFPKQDDHRPKLLLEVLPRHQPIELPLANFVYERQGGWLNARGNAQKRDDQGRLRDSRHVIEEYAARSTEAPPIEKVAAYIQPNGLVLYEPVAGLHRTAAAVMRGDPSIKTKSLEIRTLDANLMPLPDSPK